MIKIDPLNFDKATFYRALMHFVDNFCGIERSHVSTKLEKCLMSLVEEGDKQHPFYTTNELINDLKDVSEDVLRKIVHEIERVLSYYHDRYEDQNGVLVRNAISRVYFIKEALKGVL